jgi:hypothetical protein
LNADTGINNGNGQHERQTGGSVRPAWLFISSDFRNYEKEFRQRVAGHFDKYFDRESSLYGAVLDDQNLFTIELFDFFFPPQGIKQETTWLVQEGIQTVIDSLYHEFAGKQADTVKIEFYGRLIRILALARNFYYCLYYQIAPALTDNCLECFYTSKVSFMCKRSSDQAIEYNPSTETIEVNLKRFLEDEEGRHLNSLRFMLFYLTLLQYQLENKDSIAHKVALSHAVIEDDHFRSMSFDRSILNDHDRTTIDERLAKVTAEWAADYLSYDKDIREEGVRNGIRRTLAKINAAKVAGKFVYSDYVLEIASRAAIASVTGYPEKNEDLRLLLLTVNQLPRGEWVISAALSTNSNTSSVR